MTESQSRISHIEAVLRLVDRVLGPDDGAPVPTAADMELWEPSFDEDVAAEVAAEFHTEGPIDLVIYDGQHRGGRYRFIVQGTSVRRVP